jgi:hypothetical protein
MSYEYYTIDDVNEKAEEFKRVNDLTDFEALQLALTFCRNEIEAVKMECFKRAFMVPDNLDDLAAAPVVLESIAMALGYDQPSGTITNAIKRLIK